MRLAQRLQRLRQRILPNAVALSPHDQIGPLDLLEEVDESRVAEAWGGMLVSTRQTARARVSRSARYGSMNFGHSSEMDFEIFA